MREKYWASFFKWLVAWKQGFLTPKLSNEKAKNRILRETVIEGPEAPGVVIDRFLHKIHSNKVLFKFLSDRVFLRVPFWSSVVDIFSGSSVIVSFPESLVLFFWHAVVFFLKMCYCLMFCFTIWFQEQVHFWSQSINI